MYLPDRCTIQYASIVERDPVFGKGMGFLSTIPTGGKMYSDLPYFITRFFDEITIPLTGPANSLALHNAFAYFLEIAPDNYLFFRIERK